MTAAPESAAAADGQPTAEQAALAAEVAARGGTAAPVLAAQSPTDERPELAVGAAFGGGLVLALLLKRLGR